jgi:hypothetical protein
MIPGKLQLEKDRYKEVPMARQEGVLLDSGDRFPEMAFETVAHGRVRIDENFFRGYGVVLVYRGHW